MFGLQMLKIELESIEDLKSIPLLNLEGLGKNVP